MLDLPRQGKAAALNTGVAHSSGEILVFTDADNYRASDTLSHLLAPLGDSGNRRLCRAHGNPGAGQGPEPGRQPVSPLRRLVASGGESHRLAWSPADGALLALRRVRFQPIPAQVNDDFFLSTCALAAGKSIVYAPMARVTDQGVDAGLTSGFAVASGSPSA